MLASLQFTRYHRQHEGYLTGESLPAIRVRGLCLVCQFFWENAVLLLIENYQINLVSSTGYIGSTHHSATVTTRITTFFVGNPYNPSFPTVTGWCVDLKDIYCI